MQKQFLTLSTSADGARAPVEEEKVIYFKDYGGKENPVPLSATTANITLYGKKDAENLALLTQLKELNLNGSSSYPITNLEMVKSLSNLEVLNVADEDITDISALAELKNLKDLNLLGNEIQDISSLAGLSSLEELRLQ